MAGAAGVLPSIPVVHVQIADLVRNAFITATLGAAVVTTLGAAVVTTLGAVVAATLGAAVVTAFTTDIVATHRTIHSDTGCVFIHVDATLVYGRVAVGFLIHRYHGRARHAARHCRRQVVPLLVVVAGRHVHADVAAGVLPHTVAHAGGVGHTGVVGFIELTVLPGMDLRIGHAEHEAGIRRRQGRGIVLLVVVTRDDVEAHVAGCVLQGLSGGFRVVIQRPPGVVTIVIVVALLVVGHRP